MVTRNGIGWWTAAVLATAGMLVVLGPNETNARTKNPPGCRNAGPQAHNPNCSGGSGTHVPARPEKDPVPIQTVPQAGGGDAATPAAPTPTPVAPAPLPAAPPPAPSTPTPSAPNPTPTQATPAPAPAAPNPTRPTAPAGQARGAGNALTTGSPGRAAGPAPDTFGMNAGHGQPVSGYGTHIVPGDPLHLPRLVPLLGAGRGAEGIDGDATLPSRIQPLPPTDVRVGDYTNPVAGFRPDGAAEQGTPGSATGTGGQGQLLVHIQRHDGTPTHETHVPPKPGKNFVPGYRSYLVSSDGQVSACVISGMGKRTVINQAGQSASYGHSETLHFRSSSTAHLPSNHQLTSRCLVSVQKGE